MDVESYVEAVSNLYDTNGQSALRKHNKERRVR
jgi:hypothetical protein